MDGFRKTKHIGFCGIIGRHQRPCQKACRRCHIQDITTVLLHKILQKQFRQDMHCTDIQVDHVQFCFQRHFPRITKGTKACIIDEDIDMFGFGFFI